MPQTRRSSNCIRHSPPPTAPPAAADYNRAYERHLPGHRSAARGLPGAWEIAGSTRRRSTDWPANRWSSTRCWWIRPGWRPSIAPIGRAGTRWSARRPGIAQPGRDAPRGGVHSGAAERRPDHPEHPLAVDFDEVVRSTRPGRCRWPAKESSTDAPGPLLRADHRLAAIGAAAVLALVPSGQPGRQPGTRRWSSAGAIGKRATRRRRSRPRCPTAAWTTIPIPTRSWAVTQSYAGQVSLLDTCLGGLVEFLRGSPLAGNAASADFRPRAFPWASTAGSVPATTPCTASWFTCRWCCGFPTMRGRPAEPSPGRAGRTFGRRSWTTGGWATGRNHRRPVA